MATKWMVTGLVALSAVAAWTVASVRPATADGEETPPSGIEKKEKSKEECGEEKECGGCCGDEAKAAGECGKCEEGGKDAAAKKDGEACAKCAEAKKAGGEMCTACAATVAPVFTLKDTNGTERALKDLKGKIVVLEWINHGCPFVVKHYGSDNMQSLQRKYTEKGVVWLSICSSADGKQGYMSDKEWNEKTKNLKAAPTAVLTDADGKVGRLYGAKTTPFMVVIDKTGKIAYKGAIDDKATANQADIAGSKNYVVEALDAVLEGKAPTTKETKSYGCGVKYAQ